MTKSTDTTFFTNEPWQTLLDRFVSSLPKGTQFFDVLVGYFRSSGFLSLYKSLEWVEKIRIIVWLNLDKRAYDLIQYSKQSSHEAKTVYWTELQKELEESEDTRQIEEWILKFIEFIETGKLEIRVYPHAPIHAKLYIMRKNQETHEDLGKVITGSSNFSQNGLRDQLEFNVELKEARDVEYALEKFEDLWKDSVDVTHEYVDTIKTKTWLNQDITPYELYLKFLYEYFADRINEDKNDFDYTLPSWFKELKYQKDAVKDAISKIKKYNGVFLADVVWLGKTFISALLAQQLSGGILVICPPHLIDYWKDTFFEFKVTSYEVESIGKLDHIIKKWHEKYRYVFIDEAHRFRNEDTGSYEMLRAICHNKKVVLVSATPFNNAFSDLLSLITLFQQPRQSTIPNIKNLEWFFKKLENDIKKIDKKENYGEYMDMLKNNSKIIRERILKHLMIRRTRKEITTYFKQDLEGQWLSFPEVVDPKVITYEFDEVLDQLFERTLASITSMSYARYTPSLYIHEWVQQIQIVGQLNLKWFMKTLMVKRLESSFTAFRNTLTRMLGSYKKFIEMYEKWDIFVSKKVDIYAFLDNDNLDALVDLIDKWDVIQYKKTDFRNDDEKNYETDLYADYELLQNLSQWWESATETITRDPKLEKLKDILENDPALKNKQLIIFSESMETVQYLEKKLESLYPGKVYGFSSQWDHGDKDIIRQNFDPKHDKPKEDIRILITTDVLAEWINLHTANIIINYDIPWNPTRVLQRIGRINRVGTKHTHIYIYNFFPTKQWNDAIQLNENVKSKMEAFIKLLGSDSKHLTESEEVEVHTLFDKLNSAEYLSGEDGEDINKSEIKYLTLMRDIRDKEPEFFEKIRKLPKKSRTWRESEKIHKHLLSFFRKWDFLKTYLSNDNDSQELDFWQTVDIMECNGGEPKKSLHSDHYYSLLEANKRAFNESMDTDDSINEWAQKGRSNEKDLIKIVNVVLAQSWLVDKEEQFFTNLRLVLQEGKLPKKTLKDAKKAIDGIVFDGAINPTKIYMLLTDRIDPVFLARWWYDQTDNDQTVQVILNTYFI